MTDINWDERPTPDHKALVHKTLNVGVLWVKHIGGGSYRSDKGAIFQDDHMFTIHHKPEPKEYKPEVGGLCEAHFIHDGWCKRYYLGFTKRGEHVVESHDGSVSCHPRSKVRPIKTEREEFIEKAIDVMNLSIDDSQQGWAEALYDNGARFTEGKDE